MNNVSAKKCVELCDFSNLDNLIYANSSMKVL